MMISGHPGIGKSALVNEIQKPIIAKRGYFIAGKYNQFGRDVPYSSIIQAFKSLVQQVLTESEERIAMWRKNLLDSLGPNGKVITDVIQDVELIIGKQEDIPELDPEESQNRFKYTFKNFINTFTRQDHPVALFLDDLQWADSSSIELIGLILKDPDIHHIFFIGSYRDNEVSDSHILMSTLAELQKAGIKVNHIKLLPLDRDSINNLISNFLRCDLQESISLAEIVHSKTGGNPFFVNQFLKRLYEVKLIYMSQNSGLQWDIEEIKKQKVTDNVVELMAEKIVTLPEKTQEILKLCSCIGNRFELEMLSIIYDRSIDETLHDLNPAIEDDLMLLKNNEYRFQHDRIQEAAYSLIEENTKQEMHYKIGNYLIANYENNEFEKRILYITNQLNSGSILIKSTEEKIRLVGLNLKAGKKSRNTTAYGPALNYVKTGIELAEGNAWQDNYALMLDLHNEAAESAYLLGRYDEMENFLKEIEEHSLEFLDRLKSYEIKILSYSAQSMFSEAIKMGMDFLKKFRIKFPKEPTIIHIGINFILTKILFLGKSIEELSSMPMMNDKEKLAIIRILSILTQWHFTINRTFYLCW